MAARSIAEIATEAVGVLEQLKALKGSKFYGLVRERAEAQRQLLREAICDMPCREQKDFLSQEYIKGQVSGLSLDPLEALIEEAKQMMEGA